MLLPALVWRAGQAAAAVRYAALSALCTMLGGGLLSPEALLELVRSAGLLPLLSQVSPAGCCAVCCSCVCSLSNLCVFVGHVMSTGAF